MNELVYKGQGDQVLTTSLKVAEVFGKEHSSVLRSIDTLASKITDTQCVNLFTDTSVEVQQPNGGVRHNRVVVMNRDGFTLLAMGFNGKKAVGFKLEYIKAFNEMEKALKEQNQFRSMSELEILAKSAQALLEQSRRLDNVEKRLDAMEQERR